MSVLSFNATDTTEGKIGAGVSPLTPMTTHERLRVLELGRGRQTQYERNSTIHERFADQARRSPHAVAVRTGDVTLTYRELERRANRLARYLHALGVEPQTTVGVAFERSSELPVTLLAILKLGAAYVPLDTSYPPERITFMLADAGVNFVIAQDELCADWPHDAAAVIRLDACAADIARAGDEPLHVETGPLELAYIMYTSGSTGRPKGVAVPHRGVMRLVRGADYFEIAPADVFLHVAPLAFDASTFEIWAPLLNGAQLAIPRQGLLSIDDLGRAVERFGVTTMWLTTSLFQRVVDSKLPAFNRLRRVVTGGDVASPAHVRRFFQTYPTCVLAAAYGPTENTTFSTSCELTPADATGTGVPIGRPIANATAYVLDEQLELVPLGTIGELCVGGDGLARGYVNLPGLTAERFVPDPYSDALTAVLYRTGDRARLRADGILEFHGRLDNQVKIRGFRIELGEVEAAFRGLPGVADAAVVAAEEMGQKVLIAYVVPAREARLAERDLRALVRAKLPEYMLAHRVTFVEQLPLHRSGKIDRVALAKLTPVDGAAASRPAAAPARAVTPPGTPSANAIADSIGQLWREVLGPDWEPQNELNFFDAGGDSLRLLSLLALYNERFTLDLNVLDLFEYTTIAAHAALIASRVRPAPAQA